MSDAMHIFHYDLFFLIMEWINQGKLPRDLDKMMGVIEPGKDYGWMFEPHGLTLFKAILIKKGILRRR